MEPDDGHVEEVIERYDQWMSEGRVPYATKVIPIEESFDIQQWVLPTEQAINILSQAKIIGLFDCVCRTRYKRCDHPVDVCLILNKIAEKQIADGKAKKITIEEAQQILRIANEEGLVHMTATKPKDRVAYQQCKESSTSETTDGFITDFEYIYAVCSCCPCCCYGLQALSKFGRKDMTVKSEYIAQDNTELCTDCGDCVERCLFGAREVMDGEMIHKPEECYGCGLCVTACSSKAITMRRRL